MLEAAFSILGLKPGLSENPELTSLTRLGGRQALRIFFACHHTQLSTWVLGSQI